MSGTIRVRYRSCCQARTDLTPCASAVAYIQSNTYNNSTFLAVFSPVVQSRHSFASTEPDERFRPGSGLARPDDEIRGRDKNCGIPLRGSHCWTYRPDSCAEGQSRQREEAVMSNQKQPACKTELCMPTRNLPKCKGPPRPAQPTDIAREPLLKERCRLPPTPPMPQMQMRRKTRSSLTSSLPLQPPTNS